MSRCAKEDGGSTQPFVSYLRKPRGGGCPNALPGQGGFKSVLVAASRDGTHARFFREPLAQVGKKWKGDSPLDVGACRKPVGPGTVKVIQYTH